MTIIIITDTNVFIDLIQSGMLEYFFNLIMSAAQQT